jgi:hypothetical protein
MTTKASAAADRPPGVWSDASPICGQPEWTIGAANIARLRQQLMVKATAKVPPRFAT